MTARFLRRAGLCAMASLAASAALLQNPVRSQDIAARATGAGENVAAAGANRAQSRMQQVTSGDKYDVWRFEFRNEGDCKAAAARAQEFGVVNVSAFSKFWLFLVKAGDKAALQKLNGLQQNGLVWWEQESRIKPPPPPPHVLDPNAPQLRASEPIVRGGIEVGGKRYTGKSVVIAVIDTGCDFRQKDFIVEGPDGKTSRFLCYWDTYSTEYDQKKRGSAPMIDFKYPNGASVGTLYTREQLNAELRSPIPTIPDPDADGHGTGCAGVAAGNGRGIPVPNQPYGKYAGVAPEADLIGIRIADPAHGFQNAFLLGLFCEFAQKVAGDRPLVITCSFGGQYGGRDGFKIKEREVSARFPLNSAHQAICIAAGNEREDGLHARATIAPGEVREISSVLDPEFPSRARAASLNNASAALLEIYVDGLSDPNQLLFAGPKDIGYHRNRLSKSHVFEFESSPAGSFKMKNSSSDTVVVDAYIDSTVANPENDMGRVRFAPTSVSMQNLTGSPSSAETAITVGSYDFNNEFNLDGKQIFIPVFPYGAGGQAPAMSLGKLSAYSNPGPLRKGGNKPDLAAPGQWHIVPAIEHLKRLHAQERAANNMKYSHLIDSSGQYRLFNGTSAATPYTAGVVALMFEKNPKLTFGQVKDLLHSKAARVGTGWDKEFGYGKLNLEAVTAIMNAIP